MTKEEKTNEIMNKDEKAGEEKIKENWTKKNHQEKSAKYRMALKISVFKRVNN